MASEISRKAADRLKRTVRKVERWPDTPPPSGPSVPVNVPIMLVRAQEDISAGNTGKAKRLVKQNDDDDKGDEVVLDEEFDIFSRSTDVFENDDVFVRWIDGGYEVLGGRASASVRIIGPCSVYTIPAGDPDSDFDVDFGSGCDGPSRYGLTYRNLETGTYGAYDLMLDTTSPLVYLTDDFTHECVSSTLTIYAKLTVTDTDVDGVSLTLHLASDDSQIVEAVNSIYRWQPLLGGDLQNIQSPCDCTTFPYDFCVAPPNR